MAKIELACIIDDDPIFVYGAKRIMKLAEFAESFMVFHNGYDALVNLSRIIESGERSPDLILLDLNMPVLDGWQFLDKFVTIPAAKDIVVYIITSSISQADRSKAENYGLSSRYIVKPITPEDLTQIIQDINFN